MHLCRFAVHSQSHVTVVVLRFEVRLGAAAHAARPDCRSACLCGGVLLSLLVHNLFNSLKICIEFDIHPVGLYANAGPCASLIIISNLHMSPLILCTSGFSLSSRTESSFHDRCNDRINNHPKCQWKFNTRSISGQQEGCCQHNKCVIQKTSIGGQYRS